MSVWLVAPDEEYAMRMGMSQNQWYGWWAIYTWSRIGVASAFFYLAGVLPLQLGVVWTAKYCIVFQAAPYLTCAGILSSSVLERMAFHHMVTLNDYATMKFKGLLLWPILYMKIALIYTIAAIF